MSEPLSEYGDLLDEAQSPLDCVEEVLVANDWTYERSTAEAISVSVTGKMGDYTLLFEWQRDHGAMMFSCTLDLPLGAAAKARAALLMADINANLWFGHFGFTAGGVMPCFRHTTLFGGLCEAAAIEHVETLVETALNACENHYPAFDLLAKGAAQDDVSLSLALMPVAGQS